MICKRCGSACPERTGGYCFHCLVAVEIMQLPKELSYNPDDYPVKEGFPEWVKPTKQNQRVYRSKQSKLL